MSHFEDNLAVEWEALWQEDLLARVP